MNEEQERLLRGVAGDLEWLKSGISVNGSKGLEPILRDQHQKLVDHSTAIGELRAITETVRTRKKLFAAVSDYVRVRPGLKVFLTGLGTLALTLIGAILKHYFHIF